MQPVSNEYRCKNFNISKLNLKLPKKYNVIQWIYLRNTGVIYHLKINTSSDKKRRIIILWFKIQHQLKIITRSRRELNSHRVSTKTNAKKNNKLPGAMKIAYWSAFSSLLIKPLFKCVCSSKVILDILPVFQLVYPKLAWPTFVG